MGHSVHPDHTLATSIDKHSLYNFRAGEVGQWYYAGLNMSTGVIYLVPSVDPSGRMATDKKKFKNVLSVEQTHGGHGSRDLLGAGHFRALMSDNRFFSLPDMRSHCAAFSVEKTGADSASFRDNSGINGMGSFEGHSDRQLPELWFQFIQERFMAALNAAPAKSTRSKNECCTIL